MKTTTASLLNRAECRRYILDAWRRLRPGHEITRVSAEALAAVEAHLRASIRQMIETHPSAGKTFRP